MFRRIKISVLFAAVLLLASAANAEENVENNFDVSLQKLKIGILAYIDYSAGQKPLPSGEEMNFNRFAITRGYINIEKEIRPWLYTRVTPDVLQDESSGNYFLRLKYLYALFKFPDLGPFTNLKSEVGMGHMPWLDFEESTGQYRAQGSMASERAGLFSSADIGVGLFGYFGGRLEDSKKRVGSDSYDGRFGSFQIGVYNGSGYNGVENNQNKVVAGRVTLRPLPGFLPGLQLSYFGLFGEGNTKFAATGEFPDVVMHIGMLSYQHPWFQLSGQYFASEGNTKGNLVGSEGDALSTAGYSFYGRAKLPIFKGRAAVFGRYDHFDADMDADIGDEAIYDLWFAGLAFDLYKGNTLLFVWEQTDYGDDSGGKGKGPKADNKLGDDNVFQVVLQVKF